MKKILKYALVVMPLLGFLIPESAMAWVYRGAGWNTGFVGTHQSWHRNHYNCAIRKVCYHHNNHKWQCRHMKVCH